MLTDSAHGPNLPSAPEQLSIFRTQGTGEPISRMWRRIQLCYSAVGEGYNFVTTEANIPQGNRNEIIRINILL